MVNMKNLIDGVPKVNQEGFHFQFQLCLKNHSPILVYINHIGVLLETVMKFLNKQKEYKLQKNLCEVDNVFIKKLENKKKKKNY